MKNKKITVFYGVLIFLLFLLAVLTIVIPKVLSVTPYVISDDKMAPEYHKDGLVFVKRCHRTDPCRRYYHVL